MTLTRADIERAAKHLLANYGGPRQEFHNPKCPKILTRGEKACRCGDSPTEGMFDDEAARLRALREHP